MMYAIRFSYSRNDSIGFKTKHHRDINKAQQDYVHHVREGREVYAYDCNGNLSLHHYDGRTDHFDENGNMIAFSMGGRLYQMNHQMICESKKGIRI